MERPFSEELFLSDDSDICYQEFSCDEGGVKIRHDGSTVSPFDYKNDVLIDIIGIEADGGTFAEDVTLIRKPSVQFPTTTFDINEWNTASNNDCSNLGSHNQTLSSITNEIQEIKIYPNPAKTNTITIATQTNLNIEIYNILGKRVLVTQITPDKNKVNISTLNSGVYIVNLKSNNKSITKKLIKQ